MQTRKKMMLAAAAFGVCGAVSAQVTVPMNLLDQGDGGNSGAKSVGQVVISETPYGIVLTPSLAGLPPGQHGFHVHENPSCDPREQNGKLVPALAAGGHLDPGNTKRHGFAWGDGHLGDLPVLVVDPDGKASIPVLAPRLKLADVKGRALMIHAGGDNHADHPSPLGGGGARLVCGVIK